ncbi:hypothetical protein ABZ819_28550 [Streptomyces venezuelae]|uniref:hypothetical protein n=1 Tax=Streptomyces venezuelae TaxID=54571 RepID=UPI00341C2B4B
MTTSLHLPGHADEALAGPGTRVLHALHVAGWVATERFEVWGVADAGTALALLQDDGLVRLVKSPRGELYGLTPDGTQRAKDLLAAWRKDASPEERSGARSALAGFEAHDSSLKHLVTDYQRQGDGIGEKLAAFDADAAAAVDAVGAAHPLWESYPARLRSALDRVRDGDTAYVTSPLVESYHTVWHLAHRDMRLLCADLT